MFPSSGFFKNLNCPHNDGMPCSRPYCHFRHNPHQRKTKVTDAKAAQKPVSTNAEFATSSLPQNTSDIVANQNKVITEPTTSNKIEQSALLNQVLSDALKKAISENPILSQSIGTLDLISHVDATTILKNAVKHISSDVSSKAESEVDKKQPKLYLPPPGTPSYNPTPISELKQKKGTSSLQQYEYTPTSITKSYSYADKLLDSPDAEFSPAEEDEQSKADFDILEEVLAEQSSTPLRIKAINDRKCKLKKERSLITKNVSCKVGLSNEEISLKRKSNDSEDNTCDNSFLPPSPVFKSSADIPNYQSGPITTMSKVRKSPVKENTVPIQQCTKDNIPAISQPLNKERKILKPQSSHSMLPKIAHLSRPLVKDYVPIVKVAPTLPLEFSAVEELLQKLDGGNDIESAECATNVNCIESKDKSKLAECESKEEDSTSEHKPEKPLESTKKEEKLSEISTIKERKCSSKVLVNSKRKFESDDEETIGRKHKRNKRSHRSHSKHSKKSKRYSGSESDSLYSAGESDSSSKLDRHKRRKHRKRDKHRKSSKKSKKHRRKRKHKRSKHRSSSSFESSSNDKTNSEPDSEVSPLPVALCDIKVEKNDEIKAIKPLPVLVTSIKQEFAPKELEGGSILEHATEMENKKLTADTSMHKKSCSRSSNDAKGASDNSNVSNGNVNVSLFDIVEISLKQEKMENSKSILSPVSISEKSTVKQPIIEKESVMRSKSVTLHKDIYKPKNPLSSDDSCSNSHVTGIVKADSIQPLGVSYPASKKSREDHSKSTKRSLSTETHSSSKHHHSTADHCAKIASRKHIHPHTSKNTHLATNIISKTKKPNDSSSKCIHPSESKANSSIGTDSHSLATKDSYSTNKDSHSATKKVSLSSTNKDSHASTNKDLHSSSNKDSHSSTNKSSHSSTNKDSHSSTNKDSHSSTNKDSHSSSNKDSHSSSNKDSHSSSNRNLSQKVSHSSSDKKLHSPSTKDNSHSSSRHSSSSTKSIPASSPKNSSSNKNSLKTDSKRNSRQNSTDSVASISGKSRKASSDFSIPKLKDSQDFSDLLSSADVFSAEKVKKRKHDQSEKRQRKHSQDRPSKAVNERSSPDIGSPMPDLSALDEIGKEDWDQLLDSNAKPPDMNANSSDDDMCTLDQATVTSNENPDSTFDSDDANDPKVMQECFQLFSSYNPVQSQQQSLKPKQPAKKVEKNEAADVPVRYQRNARTGATGNLLGQSPALKRPLKKTPAEVMLDRYQKLVNAETALQKKLAHHRSRLERTMAKDSSELVSSSRVSSSSRSSPSISSSSVSSTSGISSSADQYGVSSSGYGGKKRIARAPSNVSALMNPKSKLLESRRPSTEMAKSASSSVKRDLAETIATTNPKGQKRFAHFPTKTETLERPVIASNGRSKVPQNIRQRYLNTFIEETKTFCETTKIAYDIAVAEENVCHDRASTRMVYLNLAVNTVKRLRNHEVSESVKEILHQSSEDETLPIETVEECVIPKKKLTHPVNPNHKTMSHFSVMASGGQSGSWSIESSRKSTSVNVDNAIRGSNFYKYLKKYILSTKDLEENGFPSPDPKDKAKAIIKKVNFRKKINPSAHERICARCSIPYKVDDYGVPLLHQGCVYHWGRNYKTRGRDGFETKYSCCQSDNSADGCCLADVHVSDNYNPDCLRGFVRTFEKENDPRHVYALDCEMCYTTEGNELTRITVINSKKETVYETLVLPDNPIIDYNTRFSGISVEDMKDVTVSLRDVQAALLTKFSSKTILMGHSLESDFLALKLMHNRVVDTSVVFPHKLGPPYKRALRNLASELLKKLIQNDVGGHDSAEDAVTCIELMHWKVKDDLKLPSPPKYYA